MKISVKSIDHLQRYGHAAVVSVDDDKDRVTKMFVFGGFSGTARHDVLKLTLACKSFNFESFSLFVV